MQVFAAGRDSRRHVDEAAQIWAEATAARDGDDEVASLEFSRPIIENVLDRSPRSVLLVACCKDGTVSGFAAVEPVEGPGGNRAEVSYFGVRPDMWGNGIGRALLTALPPYLKAAGYSYAELSVYVNNIRATALYEHLGWLPRGAPTSHPRTGKPEQRYELRLTDAL